MFNCRLRAKENWVPCEVRLLTDDVDTFLCIKSRAVGLGQTEEDLKSIFSGLSATGTISSSNASPQPPSGGQVPRSFTALCNLSEYKSCTVVTVSVNETGHFALKLVPAGIFGNKRLYLAMSSETEATTWMSMIKAGLGKKKKSSRNPLTQSRDSLSGALRTSSSQDTLRADPTTNSDGRYDLDIDTIDNEVYEPCSSQDLIPAVVQQRGDWDKLRLSKLDCFLRLSDDRLELLDSNGERVLHWFPYLLIRRFGAVGGVLRVDAGRRCSTGDGHFFFTCSPNNGQPVDAIVSQIRQLALEAKQRLRQEQAARQHLQQNRHSFTSETASSGATSMRPPPIPAKGSADSGSGSAKSLTKLSERSPSPKNTSKSSSNDAGGNFKRALSTPARQQVEEALEKILPQKEEVQQCYTPNSTMGSGVSSLRASERVNEEKNGVFIASPARASMVDLKASGQSTATQNGDSHQSGLYDNVPPSEGEKVTEQTPLRKYQGTTPSSRQAFGSASERLRNANDSLRATGRGRDSWHLGGTTRLTRSDNRAEEQDLPPAPPPPLGFRNEVESEKQRNGTATEATPPAVAPKPAIHPHPSFDPSGYGQGSSKFSWLSPMPSIRNYRAYHETSSEQPEIEFSAIRQACKQKPAQTKTLSFGSGVYETEEKSPGEHLLRPSMKGLDDVLQELRNANENVTSAVQAAERQRRAHGLTTPSHHAISKTNVGPAWTMKREA
ncbi:unnamed protein product [Mesocestoides corti]|uniref:IRS-type PTB domain-containing protein n=1 Tax=Mesocestoides corti TaxID=53468 RepID=A0A158QUT3_MESCO|nr:unnamed protein product [Mesocestoides corti]